MAEQMVPVRDFNRILFCTDFSENADFAFQHAIDMASRHTQATLYLLHVIPEPEAQFWKTYIYEVEGIDAKARHDIDAKIAAEYLPRVPRGVKLEVVMRIGRDYIQILEFARERRVDLIILGRQGKTAFSALLFGNVAERVVRKADCPVLVVPQTFKDSGAAGNA